MGKFMPQIEYDEIVTIDFNRDVATVSIQIIAGKCYEIKVPSEELRNFLNNHLLEANNE